MFILILLADDVALDYGECTLGSQVVVRGDEGDEGDEGAGTRSRDTEDGGRGTRERRERWGRDQRWEGRNPASTGTKAR